MDKFKFNFSSLNEKLHKKNKFTEFLSYLEKVSGVPRTKIFLGLASVLGLYIIFGPYAVNFVNLIGFFYPAYESLNMIELRPKMEDIKWMTYWAIYAYWFVLESLLQSVLLAIPFYSVLKCAFLICCMMSNSYNGSLIIYKHIIRPLIIQNQKNIDRAVLHLTTEAKDFLTKVSSD